MAGRKSTGVSLVAEFSFLLCDLCQINLSVCLFVLICKMKWMNHGDYFYSKLCILGPHKVIILIDIVS